MRSRPLEQALTDYIDAAAAHLAAEVAAGAEVPFEVGANRRGSAGRPALYCYRALTSPFIAERDPALKRLPSHAECARLLERFDGLERYLAASGAGMPHASRRGRAGAALKALLQDVFEDQTEFDSRPERVRAALDRLDRMAAPDGGQVNLLATLHGLAIEAPELPLRTGLTIAHPDCLTGLPAPAPGSGSRPGGQHLLVLHTAETEDAELGLAQGREALAELLLALRLFGDCRATHGALAWLRVNAGAWEPLALGAGGEPRGVLLVSPEEEDDLRAFCNLVSRRAPAEGELSWALRRFELGCERDDPLEGLTDHLLALRVLLEPEGPHSGLLPGRLAVLCAEPAQRQRLTRRVVDALKAERAAIAGTPVKPGRARALAGEIAAHLRALLSDIVGGHLDADLVGLADRLLQVSDESAPEVVDGRVVDDGPVVEEGEGVAGAAQERNGHVSTR